jgi:hypothetical protein
VAIAAGAPAQDRDALDRVPLRVTSTVPGARAVVDRGRRDGLQVGDLVELLPRDGRTYRASVLQLEERSSLVELIDKDYIPPVGTRGQALIPRERRQPAQPPEPAPAPAQPDRPQQPEQREPHPGWRNKDEGYSPDRPLLAQVRPVHPSERMPRVTGRLFAIGEVAHAPDQGSASSFGRVGTDLVWENPFGDDGGALQFDGEVDYRTEQNEERGLDLLVRRLSYAWGGTRFDPTRIEVGRFLQHAMPELGVLDGIEWTQRLDNGHRLGASAGYMPELDDDFESGHDFQFAASYSWTLDQSERWTAGAAFQKSLHGTDSDRDLLVLKTRYLPGDGWDLHGAAWVDFYSSKDAAKGRGVEVTEALASVGRRFATGNGVDLTYRRLRFPDIRRNEFRRVTPPQVADNRYDRLALTGWRWLGEDARFSGQLAGWDDEEESGASAEAGIDLHDVLGEGSSASLTLFATEAQFSNVLGARAGYGRTLDGGRWDLFYEIANHHLAGQPADRDDLVQHRIRGSRAFYSLMGWSLTADAELRLWDDEVAWVVGGQMHRSF